MLYLHKVYYAFREYDSLFVLQEEINTSVFIAYTLLPTNRLKMELDHIATLASLQL
jgi:hypothetical protein